MDKPDYKGQMPLSINRPAAYKDCAESTYTMWDPSKIEQLSVGQDGLDFATEYWYTQGSAQINFATNQPRLGALQRDVNDLLYIIWRQTTKVSFGIKDQYVTAWYCDVTPLSSLGKVEVASIESSPLLNLSSGRRLLSSHRMLSSHNENLASNAMDGNKQTYMVTVRGLGMKWTANLKKENMKVQSVRITNANSNTSRFTKYRVSIGSTACGLTPEVVGSSETVVVTCGTSPNFLIGSTVTIETTTDTHL